MPQNNKLSRGDIQAAGFVLADGAALRVKRLAITAAPTGAEQDTGFDLPAKGVVLDVFVDVLTAEVTGLTKTLSVGTLSTEGGGVAAGFLAGLSVAATGVKRGTLLSTGQTRGALLRAASNGGVVLVPEWYAVGDNAARSVSYTSGSADWVQFRGVIYVVYLELGIA